MAAAAPPPQDFGQLLQTAGLWETPAPDYPGLTAIVGGGAASNQTVTKLCISNTASRSPTAVAFLLNNDPDAICVGHSPTVYPSTPGTNTPIDELLVVLIGRYGNAVAPVALPNDAFARTVDLHCSEMDIIAGATGWARAAAPVLRQGPHAHGDADTDTFNPEPVYNSFLTGFYFTTV